MFDHVLQTSLLVSIFENLNQMQNIIYNKPPKLDYVIVPGLISSLQIFWFDHFH